MGILGISVLSILAIGATAATASSIPTSQIQVKSAPSNSISAHSVPFGNGKSGTQSYAYSQSIPTYKMKVTGATDQTKVNLKRYDYKKQQWVLAKTITKALSSGNGYKIFNIDVPKPAEGTSDAYIVEIPATSTHGKWLSQSALVRNEGRPSINLGSNFYPFGGKSSVSFNAMSRPTTTMTGVTKGSGNFYIQEKVRGTWKNIATVSKKKASNGTFSLKYTVPFKNANVSTEYRMHHPSTSTAKSWTSKSQKVKYTAAKSEIYKNQHFINVKNRYPVNTAQTTELVQVLHGSGRKAYLQTYSSKSKKWSNVSSVKLNNSAWASGKLYMPASKTQSSVKYRVHVPKSNTATEVNSASITVKYEDPRKYTGYKKDIYKTIKKWCPNILIDTARPNNSWAGLAYLGERRITVVTGLRGEWFKHTSLHECAHEVTFKTYKDDANALFKATDKVFGRGKGVEHIADCMAFRMGGKVVKGSYTTNCSGARGKAAATVLAGKRI